MALPLILSSLAFTLAAADFIAMKEKQIRVVNKTLIEGAMTIYWVTQSVFDV